MRCHLAVAVIAMLGCHRNAGSEYFGTQVTPPGVLAKIRPGMDVDELKKLVPGLRDDDGHGLLLDQPAKNIKLYAVALNDRVVDTYVDYAGSDARDVLTAAWGPPDAEPDREEQGELAWRNATTGWRAHLFCGHGTADTPLPPFCTITFHPYKPLEAMFAKTIAPVGEMAAAKPAMPVTELRAATHLPFDKPDTVLNRTLDYDGADEMVAVVDGRLFEISYRVPKLARAMIDKAWGPGTTVGTDTMWFDAQSGWFARAGAPDDKDGTLNIAFHGYMPFEKLIDVLESMTGAKDADEARKAHPELPWKQARDGVYDIAMPYNEMQLPMTAITGMTMVGVFGKGHPPRFDVGMADPAKLDAIVASFTKRWGEPKQTIEKSTDKDLQTTTYRWAGHAHVMLSGDGKDVAVVLGADP